MATYIYVDNYHLLWSICIGNWKLAQTSGVLRTVGVLLPLAFLQLIYQVRPG